MRVVTTFLLIICVALTTSLIAQSPAPADVVEIATTELDRIEKGDYAAADPDREESLLYRRLRSADASMTAPANTNSHNTVCRNCVALMPT